MTTVTLFKLHEYPDRIAINKIGTLVSEGAFFLDFSRPIKVIRWLGIRNRFIGFPVSLLVPVIHAGQLHGEFEIVIHNDDPYFNDVRAFWKENHPSANAPPANTADGFTIIGDFATQFPNNC